MYICKTNCSFNVTHSRCCLCAYVCVCLLAVRFHFVSVLSTQEFVNNFQLLCKAFRMSSREWKRRRSKGNTWENQLEKIPFILSHIRFAWKYTAYNFENINLRKLQNNMNCLWIVRLFTLCYLFDLNETWDAKCCSEINLLCGITKARHSRYVCFRREREREESSSTKIDIAKRTMKHVHKSQIYCFSPVTFKQLSYHPNIYGFGQNAVRLSNEQKIRI